MKMKTRPDTFIVYALQMCVQDVYLRTSAICLCSTIGQLCVRQVAVKGWTPVIQFWFI